MNVLVGVTGGISAYKACDIVSGLIATGHNVRVIMTESAKRFITEEALAVISQNKVYTDQNRDLDGRVTHIELSEWADAILIAPATANTINKIKYNIADNFLTTVLLAYDKENKFLAPAMNPKMWDKVKDHVFRIDGWLTMPPDEGRMACGAYGVGKLQKPRKIVEVFNKCVDK